MIIYTIIANIVSILMRTGCEYEISRDIKTGTLDRYLVKPIGYFSYRLGVFFGLKSIQLALMVILLFLSLGFFTVYLNMQIPIYNILGFMSSIITGFFITFLIFGCIGMSSFWFTEVGFLFEAARIIIITLSGGIFPLSVFGPEVQAVLDLLPFQLTTQFPTQLLCGNLSNIVILKKIAFSFIWIAMLSFILKGIWYFGLRKYHAVGS